MDKEQLISEILLLPVAAMEYHTSQHLLKLFPGKAMIETEGGGFYIEGFAKANKCTLTRQTFTYNQTSTFWRMREPEVMHLQRMGMRIVAPPGMLEDLSGQQSGSEEDLQQETQDMLRKAWLEVQWEGKTLDVLLLDIEGAGFQKQHYWVLADSEEIARSFLAAVCKWNTEIRSEVLVFDGGHWHKDELLFQDIKAATFDNLILHGNLKQEIRDDLEQFFTSRALYEEHDIPWKRGILFIGPAGNGKTHAVKALLNSLGKPCLYVKSFRSPHTHGADEIHIRQVFDRARRSTPCVLVLEDLDSLITPQNRSFFLNELDGFASNIGIVALATTNHPERLDPAILDRPSRFDRKYHFNLPELAERQAYIEMWNKALKSSLQLSEEGVAKISSLTEGFSFAYLKELFLSSKMRWIARPEQGTMEEVMVGQVNALREQMVSTSTLPVPESSDEPPLPPGVRILRGGVYHPGRM